MPMIKYFVFAALVFAAPGLEPSGKALSEATARRLESLEADIGKTLTGRRLLAETESVSRLEKSWSGAPIRYFHGQPSTLVLDPSLLRDMNSWEAELVLVRELARASADLPIEMPEGEMAAYQSELEFSVELAAADPVFDRRLRQAYHLMEKKYAAREEAYLRRRAKLGYGEPAPAALLPRDEIDRAAFLLHLFGQDRDEFYWAIEQGLPYGPGAVRLQELEDFMSRHGSELGALEIAPEALYVRIKERRYSPALVRAARSLSGTGEMERVMESLGSFETLPIPALKTKINDWIRGS